MRHKDVFYTVVLIVTIASISVAAVSAYGDDAKQLGKDQGASIKDKFGNKEGLKSGLINPIISDNTLLSTLDGSTSFNAQLVCPSSKKFLEVFVQPGGSGDLVTVIVSEDTNMDGTSDYSYQVPFLVSGVCANGVISSSVGSWSSLKYYKWAADDSYRAVLQEVSPDKVGGCYCINSSCGSNLVWNNLSTVLKDLGGGVAGAVSAKNPKFTVSNVQIDGASIIYYGQDSAKCSTVSGGSGSNSPEKYYGNYAVLNADVNTQVISQSGDPGSYYSMLKNSLYMQSKQSEVNTCTVDRLIACVPNTTSYTNTITDLCTALENNPKCKLRDEKVDGVTTYRGFNPTMLSPQPVCKELSCQIDATCQNNLVYDGGYVPEGSGCNSQGITGTPLNGYWDCLTTSGVSCDIAADSCTVHGTAGTFLCSQVDAGGEACVKGLCSGQRKAPCLSNEEPSTLTCTEWDESANCTKAICQATAPHNAYTAYIPAGNSISPSVYLTLSSAKGICSGAYYIGIYNAAGTLVAYTNGTAGCGNKIYPLTYQAPTGGNYTIKIWMSASTMYGSHGCEGKVNQIQCPLDPNLPCSGSVAGSSMCVQTSTYNVCDWWHKERTYLCETANAYDFSAAQKRLKVVTSTAKDNTSSFYYSDYRDDGSGTWITEGITSLLPERDAFGDCDIVCKVKTTGTDTQVSDTGTTAKYRQDTQCGTFYYRTCNNGTCPLNAGEDIVKDCQCINEFAEAAAIMQTIRQAGRDMICSDGASKPLK